MLDGDARILSQMFWQKRRRSLDGLLQSEDVEVVGVVAGDEVAGGEVASPITQRSGLAIAYRFADPDDRVLALGWLGASLSIEVGGLVVRVELSPRLAFVPSGRWSSHAPRSVGAYARAHEELGRWDPLDLRYDERVLSAGDRVVLRAEVRAEGQSAGGYRGHRVDFVCDAGELELIARDGVAG